uniref:Uncharacterized protein n=1 Tax=Cucumis melo TaxID=3656 RepID=A0A9I9DQN8_CUCME
MDLAIPSLLSSPHHRIRRFLAYVLLGIHGELQIRQCRRAPVAAHLHFSPLSLTSVAFEYFFPQETLFYW